MGVRTNDAEELVQTINGKRTYKDRVLRNAEMLWRCTVEGCPTEPKVQRRKQYKDRTRCNACSNKFKLQDPDFLIKRGRAISKSIENLGDKWSKVATKNMSSESVRKKISDSVKETIRNNPNAKFVRKETAIKNNAVSGFGTPEFSRNTWASMSPSKKTATLKKIVASSVETDRKIHEELMISRYPGFEVIEFSSPDNTYRCPKGHVFFMRGGNFLKRGNCPECAPKSKLEVDLRTWMGTLLPDVRSNKRVLFLSENRNGNRALEIDCYSESKKFGVEVHGLYFHKETRPESELYEQDMYGVSRHLHRLKSDLADKEGITLLQFFEDEINTKSDIVKSIIKSKLGLFETKIHARECVVKPVEYAEEFVFIEKNHLQGYCKSFFKLGLYYNEELVSILTFRRGIEGQAEIARFCTKMGVSVTGSFSRLLHHSENFLKSIKISSIVTYSDKRYSNGGLYRNNGFEFIHTTEPDFFWIKGKSRYARQISWGKSTLEMYLEGYDKIYGVGHLLFKKDI